MVTETAKVTESAKAIRIFYAYAREDEVLRDELEQHLSVLIRQNRIINWYDRKISAGSEWGAEIASNLNTSDIVLLLVSPAFIASDYCYGIEMTRALERHEAKEAIAIPIILRPLHWDDAPFSHLQVLPSSGKA